METAVPGSLFGKQGTVPLVEPGEVVVAPVGYGGGEVVPVLPLEGEQGRGMVRTEQLQLGHRQSIAFTISERIRSVVRAANFRSAFASASRVICATRAHVLPSAQAHTG